MLKNKNAIIILFLVLVIICVVSVLFLGKSNSKSMIEGFESGKINGSRASKNDFIDLDKLMMDKKENFQETPNPNTLNDIRSNINSIKTTLQSEFPDMSRFVQRSEILPGAVCRVSNAVDKEAYVAKTQADKLYNCPVAQDFDISKYVLKSVAAQANSCPSCPTIDTSKYVLKSTIPPTQKCPDCKCPQVKVSAGLCQKCPPPPKCPEPKPCPVVECPPPKPCPPQKECPACPPKEECPPKICPPCPVIPKPTECPKCCDRDVVKILQKTVYLDANGNPIKTDSQMVNTPAPGSSLFNEQGFDKNGYDKNGYDKDGYDRNGLNKAGYNKDGYDRNGFDSRGVNANGYDRNGNPVAGSPVASGIGMNNAPGSGIMGGIKSMGDMSDSMYGNMESGVLGLFNLFGNGPTPSSYPTTLPTYTQPSFAPLSDESGAGDNKQGITAISGLITPAPTSTPTTYTPSTSTSGSLSEQATAGTTPYSTFAPSTESPMQQSYKCKANAFNSEFKQFGIYGVDGLNGGGMFNQVL
jgi:hypothetical protein